MTSSNRQIVLVFDLGGGTFDVSGKIRPILASFYLPILLFIIYCCSLTICTYTDLILILNFNSFSLYLRAHNWPLGSAYPVP